MQDIQAPGSKPNRGPVRQLIPAEQDKRFVPPRSFASSVPVTQKPSSVNNRDYVQPVNNSRRYLALGLFLSLLLISIIFFLATFAFDGATITIKPLKREVPISETYVVRPSERDEVLKEKTLVISEEITIPKKSLKKVYRKAEGEVTIYNNFSSQPQKFVKGTRLMTADEKIFRIQETVMVPGKSGDVPGSVKVRVIAAEDGVEYNIGPTRFSVPGLKASPKYKDFYAESEKTFKGGASGTVAEISDVDLQQGKEDLKQKIIEALQEKIAEGVEEGYMFNKRSLVVSVSKAVKVSEDELTATYLQSATGTTLFFKKEEIIKKILEKQYYNDTTKPTIKILDTSRFEIGISNQQEAIQNRGAQVVLMITGVAPVIIYPNKQQILEYYAGRPVSEFNDIAKKFQFIESAKRVIYPFWNTRFPSNFAKIKVEFEE